MVTQLVIDLMNDDSVTIVVSGMVSPTIVVKHAGWAGDTPAHRSSGLGICVVEMLYYLRFSLPICFLAL